MARRTKKTAGLVDALCRVLRDGTTRRAACAHVGVSHGQFYVWLEHDQTFADAIEKAEADAELRFTSIVATAAAETWQAAAWWLERRRPDDYGRRDRLELDIRRQAERVAQAYGLNVEDVLQEAERWLAH